MRFINRTKLPPSAFRCVIEGCGAISGECDHTDPKKNPGFKVLVAGIIEGTHQRMDQMLEMGPVTPMPMRMPKSTLFHLESNPEPREPKTYKAVPGVRRESLPLGDVDLSDVIKDSDE